MNDFWKNIIRYPRFLITSLTGLILIITRPFQNLFKTPQLRIFSILLIFLIFLIISTIVKSMVGL